MDPNDTCTSTPSSSTATATPWATCWRALRTLGSAPPRATSTCPGCATAVSRRSSSPASCRWRSIIAARPVTPCSGWTCLHQAMDSHPGRDSCWLPALPTSGRPRPRARSPVFWGWRAPSRWGTARGAALLLPAGRTQPGFDLELPQRDRRRRDGRPQRGGLSPSACGWWRNATGWACSSMCPTWRRRSGDVLQISRHPVIASHSNASASATTTATLPIGRSMPSPQAVA